MHVVLTGATGAIGREVARGLVAAGTDVVLACRDAAAGEALVTELRRKARVRVLDLASLASVRDACAWARAELPRLDTLINAAGVWSRQHRTTADGLELTFGVNHVAHHALAVGLLPLLQRSQRARVVTVASGLHVRGKLAWDDLMQTRGGFNGVKAYEQSKLANVMFALALARRAKVASNAVHPGLVKSRLTREYPEMFRDTPPRALLTPAQAARSILRLALDASLANATGRYFDREREAAPASAALRVADQDRLWQITEDLIAQR